MADRRRGRADPARLAAYDVLKAVRVDGAFTNLVLPRVLREHRLTGRDAAFATELAAGSRKRILLLVLIAGAVIFGIVFGGFALIRTVVGNETLASALSGVVAIPLWPVLGSLFVVLYYDLRIRKEAFDLEIMAEGLDAPSRQSPA